MIGPNKIILSKQVTSLEETHEVGISIAKILSLPACVYLTGEMGAGKTTLAKSIIQGLGYVGDVTSPTYNLIQEYPVRDGCVYHMDLYRLEEPEELEYLAVQDLWSERSLFLIEWADNGAGYLPKADAEIVIKSVAKQAGVGREIVLSCCA